MHISNHPFIKNFYSVFFESIDLDIEVSLNPFNPLNQKNFECKSVDGYIENRRQFEAIAVASFFALKSFGFPNFIRYLQKDEAQHLVKNFSNFFNSENILNTICITSQKPCFFEEPKFFYSVLSKENFDFLSRFSAKQKSQIAEIFSSLTYQDLPISDNFFEDGQEFKDFCKTIKKFKNAEQYFEFLGGQE